QLGDEVGEQLVPYLAGGGGVHGARALPPVLVQHEHARGEAADQQLQVQQVRFRMTLPQYFDQAGADLLEGLVQQAVLEGGLGVVATQGAGEVGDRGDQIGGADHFGQFVQQGDVLGQGLGRYGSSEVID